MINNYMSGIQIQNLVNQSTTVYLAYYRSDGYIVKNSTVTLNPLSSASIIDQGPAGFEGGVMIQSSSPVSVINNLVNKTTRTLASVTGFTAGSPEVNLPIVMRNNGGFSTWFAVQNTHWKTVNVTVRYYSSTNIANETTSIPAGATRFFYQAGNTSLPSGFVGAAKVQADGAVAVTVLQESSTRLLSYNGFVGGMFNTTLNAPIVMANNSSFNSGIQIQNVGVAATTATISYSPNTALNPGPSHAPPCPQPASRSRTIYVNSSVSVLQDSTNDPQFANCSYVGSITITASQPLLAIVNQLGNSAVRPTKRSIQRWWATSCNCRS